jgi:hypothetical protein
MSVEFDIYVELWSRIYEGNIVVSLDKLQASPPHI